MKNKLTIFAIITLISFNVVFAQVPAVPTVSAATSITATSFTANWASGGGTAETAYYLDVSTSSIFASFVSGYNNLNVGLVTSYSVTGLTAGPTYYYRVRGYNLSGSSASSATITVAGIPVATAATSVTNAGFSANWNAVTGATGYFLDVGTTSGGTQLVNNLAVAGITSPVVGLAGTTYYYQVRSNGPSANSNIISVTTIPANPVSSAASNVAGTSFSANWAASTGATGYYLDVATISDFSVLVSGYSNLALGAVTTYSVTGLSASTPYWYRVRAFNSGGTSANSGSQTTTTGPLANAATLISQTSFQANWSVATGSHFLQVSTSSAFGSFVGAFNGTVDLGAVGSTTVAALTAGTTYYYRYSILAATAPFSNTITVLTVAPEPVSSAASNIAGTSFSANWGASLSATGYYLDVSTVSNFASFVTGFSNLDVGNVTTYSVTGLTISTPYYYRVRAYNASGTSGNSGSQNPTTGLAVPTIGASPANYAVGVTILPSFAWSVGATWEFQIDDNSDFSSPIALSPAYVATNAFYNFTYSTTSSSVLANGTTYYWRVRKTGPPNSDWTPTAEFTTVNAAKPYINPVISGVTTAFISWHPVPFSSGLYYDLLWSTNASMSGFTSVTRLDTTTYTLTGLTQGSTYYIQVRAKNTAGTIIISYSTVTTGFSPTAPPLCYRSYPIDGATSYALKPTFFWYIKGNEPGLDYEIRYRDFTAAEAYPAPQITSTSNHTYKTLLVDLVSGHTYYWQVRSKIGGQYSLWSTAGDSSFVMYTSLAGSPVIPYTAWPSGGSTVYVNPPTFYYYIDVYATGLEFQVEYSSSSAVDGGGNFTTSPVILGWSANLFAEGTASLIPNTTYYWHARSRLAANHASISAWSSAANFIVATTASGAATTPIPSTPVGGQIIDSPLSAITLYWTASSGQSLDYQIRIAQSSSVDINGMLNHPIAVSTAAWPVTDPTHSILVTAIPYTVTAGATYYWQARSRLTANNLVVSPWSMVASFSTAAGSSSVVPLVISPNYLQPINTTSAILTWRIPVPTATHLKYDVQYSKNADFSNSISKMNVDEPVTQVTGLELNSIYYWRVLSKNDNGSSNYSSTGTFKTSGATAVDDKEVIPTQFKLSQNYPNPFNPTTKITYALPQNAFVSIKIYDMLGREVKSLVNNETLAGNHSVDWNGENNLGYKVSSGTYIYRITAGNFVAVKKMVLIK